MTADLLALVLPIGLGLFYWFWLRKRYRYWGATDEEIERAMRGDAEVPGAIYDDVLPISTSERPGTDEALVRR